MSNFVLIFLYPFFEFGGPSAFSLRWGNFCVWTGCFFYLCNFVCLRNFENDEFDDELSRTAGIENVSLIVMDAESSTVKLHASDTTSMGQRMWDNLFGATPDIEEKEEVRSRYYLVRTLIANMVENLAPGHISWPILTASAPATHMWWMACQ